MDLHRPEACEFKFTTEKRTPLRELNDSIVSTVHSSERVSSVKERGENFQDKIIAHFNETAELKQRLLIEQNLVTIAKQAEADALRKAADAEEKFASKQKQNKEMFVLFDKLTSDLKKERQLRCDLTIERDRTQRQIENEKLNYQCTLSRIEDRLKMKEQEVEILNKALLKFQHDLEFERLNPPTTAATTSMTPSKNQEDKLLQCDKCQTRLSEIAKLNEDNRSLTQLLAVKEAKIEATANILGEYDILSLHEKITNANLEKDEKVRELQSKNIEIENLREELTKAQCNIDDIVQAKGANEFLEKEISKVKQQKAEMRCRVLELERKISTLERENIKEIEMKVDESVVNELADQKELSGRLTKNNHDLANQITELKEKIVNLTADYNQANRKIESVESELIIAQKNNEQANSQKEDQRKRLEVKYDQLKALVAEQDADLDELLDKCKLLEKELKEMQLENDKLREQIKAAEMSTHLNSVDTTRLQRENERLKERGDKLLLELQATHAEYKEEINQLNTQLQDACQSATIKECQPSVVDTNSVDSSVRDKSAKIDAAYVNTLDAQKRQLVTKMTQATRRIQDQKDQIINLQDEVKQLNSQLVSKSLTDEQIKMALKVAVEKGEKYKYELEKALTSCDELRDQKKVLQCRYTEYESRLNIAEEAVKEADRLRQQLDALKKRFDEEMQLSNNKEAQQEKLINYLQNQVMKTKTQVKDPSSIKRLVNSLRPSISSSASSSTSISTNDLREAIAAEERARFQCLENQNRQLKRQLAEIERSRTTTPVTSRCLKSDEMEWKSLKSESLHSNGGKMRHDIPHRWQKKLCVTGFTCPGCALPSGLVKFALKCRECGMMVHTRCSHLVYNTCGMPTQMYNDYVTQLDNAQLEYTSPDQKRQRFTSPTKYRSERMPDSVDQGRMSGNVKVWRSDGPPKQDAGLAHWTGAYAVMDENQLRLFVDSEACARGEKPIQQVKFAKQHWKIMLKENADDECRLKKSDKCYIVEMKVQDEKNNDYRLYLMAPTVLARQRWVRALHAATMKQHIQRTSSSKIEQMVLQYDQTVFLKLEAPENLNVYSTAFLNSADLLLLACSEGLFYTSASKPATPFRVPGATATYQLHCLEDIETLVLITGNDQQIGFAHLVDLVRSIQSGAPAISVTYLTSPAIINASVAIDVSAPSGERHLCVADPDGVHILTFNSKLQIFIHFKHVAMIEPPACLTPLPDGRVIVGAEKFFVLKPSNAEIYALLEKSAVLDPSLEYFAAEADLAHDYPIDAVVIHDNQQQPTGELLLVTQNYALFVSFRDGKRTRGLSNWEWVRTPLQIAYVAPYLYVMHCECVEVFSVPAPPTRNASSALLQHEHVLKLPGAISKNVFGSGRKASELLITSLTDTRTTICRLNTFVPK